MKCYTKCRLTNKACKAKECRLWIDYPKDLNCVEVAVQKEDKLTLKNVGDRLNLTPSRIKQIEVEAVAKISKIFKKLNIL